MSIVANRHPGIRAAVVNVPEDATLTRVHNDANILCIGAQRTDEEIAKEIISAFLNADFEDGGRHERRVNKINCNVPTITEQDPEISSAINKEIQRQQNNIELIASENFASAAESLPSPTLLSGCCFAIPSAIAVYFLTLVGLS